MKSKYFKDTQGLDLPFELCSPDKVSVCLRIEKSALDYVLSESERLSITSGEYIEGLIRREARNQGGRTLM
ncbi:MAG: hypothetical protein PHI98_12870 [Eubacteriales bacterium]|nr:hypothetical protein [Eubacteriales bacterium]